MDDARLFGEIGRTSPRTPPRSAAELELHLSDPQIQGIVKHDACPTEYNGGVIIAIKHQTRLLVSLTALLVTMGTLPVTAQADSTTYEPSRVMWAAKRSNVRAGPGTSYEKVGLVEVGEEVRATGKTGTWVKLETRPGQQEGFVYAPRLTETRLTVETITSKSGNRYRGQTRDGKLHGRGAFTWADGDRYEGDFDNGKRTGRGVYTWVDGSRYEGDFDNGKRTGRGVYTWADGGRYEGDYVKDKRTGRGVRTWPDGTRYEGEFRDGDFQGRGVYTFASGARYEGEFRDSDFHGRGVYTSADGSRYEGEFVNDKRTGRGTWTQPGGQAWGAVAVETDPVGGPRHKVCQDRGFYISVNFEGPGEAGTDARTQCNADSGDCDVKRYFEGCAAFAQGYMDYADGGRYCAYGLGVGDSRNSASARAMDVCRSDALQPLVSGLGLTHRDHTDKVYGCEIRSSACNSSTELRKRQQVARRADTQRQRQQQVQQTNREGWVAIVDGHRDWSGEGGVVGVAAGRRSRTDALQAAKRDCENSGGVACGQRSGQDAWEERCIAVAEASWLGEDEMFFSGTGDTQSEAENEAENYCRKVRATGCLITKSECG